MIAPVIVAVHVNVNANVGVIDTVVSPWEQGAGHRTASLTVPLTITGPFGFTCTATITGGDHDHGHVNERSLGTRTLA